MMTTAALVLIPLAIIGVIIGEWSFYREKVVPRRGSFIFTRCDETTGWKYYNYRNQIRILMFGVQPLVLAAVLWLIKFRLHITFRP